MSLSLADSILHGNDPPREPRPTGASPMAGHVPALRGRELTPEELAGIRVLFEEAAREWTALKDEVRDLQRTLEPSTFREALEAAGITGGSAVPRAPGVGKGAAAGEAPAPRAREEVKPSAPARPVDRGGKPQARTAAPTAAPPPTRAARSGPRTSAPPPGAATAPPSTGAEALAARGRAELDSKLGELLKLLQENINAKKAGAGTPIEIPRALTLEIAREVAGRVKESVLSTLRQTPAQEAEVGTGTEKERPRPAADKRIPFDDMSAIIDQITGQR
ncbi:MAG TPA: hypothetical protein VMT52_19650 [Planctomycetota bacterium]|nr:hypothetical protein [Planctomycetota bacterium]